MPPTIGLIMKNFLTLLAIFAILASVQAEDAKKPQKVEIIRSISGSVVSDTGIGGGTVQLIKGSIYPVLKDGLTEVTLDVNGQTVRVLKDAVRPTEADGSFLRIISAKYGFPGEQQFEVKEEIKKRLPENPVKEPVKILVSDKLLRAKAGLMTRTKMVNGRVVTYDRNDAILTITYEYDSERKTQEVMEGKYLILP